MFFFQFLTFLSHFIFFASVALSEFQFYEWKIRVNKFCSTHKACTLSFFCVFLLLCFQLFELIELVGCRYGARRIFEKGEKPTVVGMSVWCWDVKEFVMNLCWKECRKYWIWTYCDGPEARWDTKLLICSCTQLIKTFLRLFSNDLEGIWPLKSVRIAFQGEVNVKFNL